jgi:CRP/FNR family transcriptional regulator, cyclic AMP receptor protein
MGVIPPLADVLGWSAAALTLLAFSCNDLVRLRYVALAASAAFIAYGLTAQLWPVLALHFVLVPINAWRLWQTLQLNRERQPQDPAPASP